MNRALERSPRLARLRILRAVLFTVILAMVVPSSTLAAGWTSDIEAAMKKAKESEKLVLLTFLGNGWDTASMNLKKDLLNKREFINKMSENYILLELSVPVDNDNATDEVKEMMNEYKVTIFPAMIVVNSEGRQLDEFRYVLKSVDWYLKRFNRIAKRHLPDKKK